MLKLYTLRRHFVIPVFSALFFMILILITFHGFINKGEGGLVDMRVGDSREDIIYLSIFVIHVISTLCSVILTLTNVLGIINYAGGGLSDVRVGDLREDVICVAILLYTRHFHFIFRDIYLNYLLGIIN